MATARTKFAVGLFLLAGTLLAVAAVIWVGMSGYLETGRKFVVYFDESVQGLDQDSPVKYRGVAIGRVESIGVAPDGRLVEIILSVREPLKEEGRLTAQLKSVGITGIMFIELDLAGEGVLPKALPMSFTPPYPVIPSQPSEFQMIFQGLETAFDRIRDLDVEGVISRLQGILDGMNRMLADLDVKPVMERAVTALDRVNEILASGQWEAILASAEKAGREAGAGAAEAREVIARAGEAVEGLSAILKENRAAVQAAVTALDQTMQNTRDLSREGAELVSGTRDRLDAVLGQTSEAARNLNRAASRLNGILEQFEANPGALLDAPPEPRKVSP
ncbi:MAG: MCE family protein [Proteobacteria bacterium]|nr:MCE family protein [Pseudomonadota bacterium]